MLNAQRLFALVLAYGCFSMAFLLKAFSRAPEAVVVNGLENTFLYADGIYGGSGPATDEDFLALAELGIRTVISVDGAIPKVEKARKFDMRYVHIPIGYDGIHEEAKLQLNRGFHDLERPIYLHCHHGIHRGPAAIGVILVGSGLLDPSTAIEQMEIAGTSKKYEGLYEEVRQMQRVSHEMLARAPALVESVEVDDLTQAMAQIGVIWDNLKLAYRGAWRVQKDHPDVDPAHEALMLHEQYRELVRQQASATLSNEEVSALELYLESMASSLELSAKLESAIRAGEIFQANEAFRALKNECVRCHDAYRN